RQSTFQVFFTFAFFLPLAFMGFDPVYFVIAYGFNLIYQFWIHTESIEKMGWFEIIFNTPSHHRVHHGKNPKYIDKNHAGVLIIWDKMFGTFQEEEERPIYGITTPLNSWDPIWANFDHFKNLGKAVLKVKNISDALKILFNKTDILPKKW
ncbi:MAG TPA: sterol desaturase family protein, partial [Bacteroidetes bacterium]|nr:sterol desaturase family protein [Bacteroidota bacterium]